jgi:hypothetical protein
MNCFVLKTLIFYFKYRMCKIIFVQKFYLLSVQYRKVMNGPCKIWKPMLMMLIIVSVVFELGISLTYYAKLVDKLIVYKA